MPPDRSGSSSLRDTRETEQRPADLTLPLGAFAALRAVGRVYLRRLWPLLVAIMVPLAPAALLSALLLALPEQVMVHGFPVPRDEPDTWYLVVRGALVVAALAGAAFGLGAAVVLGSAALMGRTIPVTAAWRIALRRVPALVAWTAGTAALTTATLWLGGARFPEGDIPPLAAVLLLPYVLSMAVWSVALSAALLEGRGLPSACSRAWALGVECRSRHMVLTLVCITTAVVAVTGAELAVGAIVDSGGDQVLGLAGRGTLLTLAAPMVLLLLCAPGVYASPDAPWDLDLARVDRNLPTAGNTAWPLRLVTVPLLAAAVVLPIYAPPLAITLPPNMTPQLALEPMSPSELVGGNHMAVSDEGTMVFLKGSGRNPLTVCNPECEQERDAEWEIDREAYEGSVHTLAAVEGGFAAMTWAKGPEPEPDPDAEPWVDPPPVGTDTLHLLRCSGPSEQGCSDLHSTEVREIPDVNEPARSAPAPLEDGAVVASYVDPDHRVEEEGLDHLDGLRAHVCDDMECSDPREVDLDGELEKTDKFYKEEPERGDVGLDVAASPGGGFTVTVQEPDQSSFTLIHCPDAACADPVTTELSHQINVPSTSLPEPERPGASIEYRPDGTPVIAHTDTRQSGTHLVDCHDAACTESTTRVLTDSKWTGTQPGLAIDSQGLPQVATVDSDTRELVLISCLDSGCSEHTTVPLSGFVGEPWMTLLELDGQDRPHLVWGRHAEEEGVGETRSPADGEYLHCTQPRCGAPAPDA